MSLLLDILLWGGTLLVGLFTALPSSRIRHGAIRAGDFPRQQLLVLGVALIPLVIWAQPPGAFWALAILSVSVVTQIVHLGRYLPLWHVQSVEPTAADRAMAGRSVTFMTANVRQSNEAHDQLVAAVRANEPDILMVLEVNDRWAKALEPLHDDYPHRVICPQDNGYGMALLSTLPLEETEVRELVVDAVPSIRATVRLCDARFRLYVVHPEPPVPQQHTEGRDAELSHVAFEARDDPLPVVVSGDLNDVAWSVTTRRFQQVSRLLDPRIGRGFYNTYHAGIPLLRWPLDHLFHSAHFRLLKMRRLPAIGSDHFPMLFCLLLAEFELAADTPDPATKRRERKMTEMIRRERASDRKAIGSDWEDED